MIDLAVNVAFGWAILVAVLALSASVFAFFYTLRMHPAELERQPKTIQIARRIGIGAIVLSILILCVTIGRLLI